MAKLVNRADPSGALTDPAEPSKDQVLNSAVIVELSDGTTAAEATIRQIVANAVNDAVIRALQNVTRDLRYNATETWATAGDSAGLHATGGFFGNTELQAVIDWAASYDIPTTITESTGSIAIRIPEGANPHDYRILLEDGSYLNFDAAIRITFGTLSGFDVYLTAVSFRGDYAKGNTIVLQHHGIDAHTDFLGGVPAIESVLTDINAALGGKQDKVAFDFDFEKHSFTTPILPQKFAIHFKNIDTDLLPTGTTQIRIIMRGSTIHNAPVPTEENTVIEAEISATEAANITNNLGNRTTLDIQFLYLDSRGNTLGRSPLYDMPITNSTTKWNRNELLPYDESRSVADSTFQLPTNYAEWNMIFIDLLQGGTETTVQFTMERLIANETISNHGIGNRVINWNKATRTFSPASGRNAATVIHAILV